MYVSHAVRTWTLRTVDFSVFLFVEVALHEFFEVFQAHVPCLDFLLAHPIVSLGSYSSLDMVFETVVEKR